MKGATRTNPKSHSGPATVIQTNTILPAVRFPGGSSSSKVMNMGRAALSFGLVFLTACQVQY
jgi:hypothetical protein